MTGSEKPQEPTLIEASPPTRSTFALSASIFLRLLAVVHLIAFLSFWVQLNGLVGPRGLLPASNYFAAAREQLGATAYFELPSLCWIFGADTFLHVLCAAGTASAVLLFVGVAPAVCLALLWAGYLSLNYAGQVFFHFQWDTLLLETTLLAVFVAPWSLLPLWRAHEPPRLARLLVAWLLFRLMFLSGLVKLTSGDPMWRTLTALTVHYETQPLPTPLGWFAHQLPSWWHRVSCGVLFALELLVPLFLFAGRTLRHVAALLIAALMVAIAFTGNYTFFNLLTMVLCLACLDDAAWLRLTRRGAARLFPPAGPLPTATAKWQQRLTLAFAVFAGPFTLLQALTAVSSVPRIIPGLAVVARRVEPLRSFNNYGLFAVMTNPRPELIFEGSDDRTNWRPYEFRHKPGALTRRPTWVAPHQPRLDWQLWFAALSSPEQNPWAILLCEHLLRGSPEVLALLEENPFPQQPPRFIRVVRYEYHFTDPATRSSTGQWWRRTPMDVWVPPSSLR